MRKLIINLILATNFSFYTYLLPFQSKAESIIEISEKLEAKLRFVILPFENLSKDLNYNYLSRAFSDGIYSGLQYFSKIILVDRNYTEKNLKELAFQNTGFTSKETSSKLGKIIGANKIITGSYSIEGNKIKVNTVFIDVETGQIQANSAFSVIGNKNDTLKLQEDLAKKINQVLNFQMKNEFLKKVITSNNTKITAYQYYLKGRELYLSGSISSLHKSIELYQKALDIDNKYVNALAGMAESYALIGYFYEKRGKEYTSYYEKGLHAIKKAELIFPEKLEVLRAKAYLLNNKVPRDKIEALNSAKEALRLNPFDAESLYIIASILNSNKEEYEKILKINPFLVNARNDLAYLLLKEKNYTLALEEFEQVLQQEPDFYESQTGIIKVYFEQNRWEEALNKVEAMINYFDSIPELYYFACLSSSKLKNYDKAIIYGEKGFKLSSDFAEISFLIANAYDQIDKTQEAINWYKIYIDLNPKSEQALKIIENLKNRNLW